MGGEEEVAGDEGEEEGGGATFMGGRVELGTAGDVELDGRGTQRLLRERLRFGRARGCDSARTSNEPMARCA